MDNEKLFEFMTKMYSEMKEGFGGLGQKVDSLEQGFGELKDDVSALKQGFGELKDDVSGLKQGFGELKDDVSGLKQGFGELKDDVSGLKQGFGELNEKVDNNHKEVIGRLDTLEKNQEAIKRFIINSDDSFRKTEEAYSTIQKFKEVFYK